MICEAEITIRAHDRGAQTTTLKCKLPKGHRGEHRQRYEGWVEEIIVEWDFDERGAKYEYRHQG